MFENSLFTNFVWLRRLHLSFLLPGVLIYMVLLNANVMSVNAQTSGGEAPVTKKVQAPANTAPTTGVIQAPVEGAPGANMLIQPATVIKQNDVITWSGNVEFRYEAQKITATAQKAEYYKSEQKVVLTGGVKVIQAGQSHEAETATFFVTNEFKMMADKVAMPGL
jgi:lipopolysaccharide assembly outer membrane protein LptD (OstA)